jgi:hypothetical protein
MSFDEIKNDAIKRLQNDNPKNESTQKTNEYQNTFINFKNNIDAESTSLKDIIKDNTNIKSIIQPTMAEHEGGGNDDINFDEIDYTDIKSIIQPTMAEHEGGGNDSINLDEIDYTDIKSIIQPTMAEHEGGGNDNINLDEINYTDINSIIQPTMAEHEGGGSIGGINFNDIPDMGEFGNILNGDAKAEKIKEQIFNEDGSINAEKAGELFESGELTVWDFEKVFGVTPNMSEQAKTTLEDGTTVYCEDMRWSGMTDSAVMVVTLPDGTEMRFEQKDKGKLTDTPNIEKPKFKETTRAMGEEGGGTDININNDELHKQLEEMREQFKEDSMTTQAMGEEGGIF